jgi:hypothetical protein
MKTEELVKNCQDRMKSISDKIETKRKSKKVYSEEEVVALLEYVRGNFYDTGLKWHSQPDTDYTSRELLEQFKNK